MIIKNCPALEDIPELTDDVDPFGNRIYKIDTPDYCCKYKKKCKDIDDCLIKRVIEKCHLIAPLYNGDFIKVYPKNIKGREIAEMFEVQE